MSYLYKGLEQLHPLAHVLKELEHILILMLVLALGGRKAQLGERKRGMDVYGRSNDFIGVVEETVEGTTFT